MSSLLQCADDLLQQRAVQSTHYERLEAQLRDRERRRRSTVLSLQQRIADVTRRSNDVVDLRRETAQLADQLTQHGLQLTALQCRGGAAQKTQMAAVSRLQDGVQSWSGHPAQLVWVIQALQVRNRLRTHARQLRRALRCIGQAWQLRRQVCRFARCCAAVSQWHVTHVAALTRTMDEKAQMTRQTRLTAQQEAERAERDCTGPLADSRCRAEQTRAVLEAELSCCDLYAASLHSRCDVAKEAVATLSDRVEAEAQKLSTWEAKALAMAVSVTQSAKALTEQRERHAQEQQSRAHEQQQVATEMAEVAAQSAAMEVCVARLSEEWDAAQQRTHTILSQVVIADLLTDLCGRVHERCAAQEATQKSQQHATQAELVQLRTQHAEQLRARHAAQAAAAQCRAREACLCQEAQQRHALTELEEDEWRLLYAQLVRELCRARAAEAAAAAAENEKKKSAAAAVVAAVPKTRTAPGKRPRGGERAVNAASRRQRAALEAVEALTLTASQNSRNTANHRGEVGGGNGSRGSRRSSPASPPSSITAASHGSHAAYRLVSLKPSVVKKAHAAAETPPADTTAAPPPPPPQSELKVARHPRLAPATTPFMATLSESDSSFSLMNDSGATEAGAVAGSGHVVATVKAAAAAGRAGEGRGDDDLSDVRVSSSSPSPPPRCPVGSTRMYMSTHRTQINLHDSSHNKDVPAAVLRPTAALPRRLPLAAGVARTTQPTTPRSALDTALLTARTPRPASVQHTSPMVYRVSATAGNASALPPPHNAGVAAGGGLSGSAGALRTRHGLFPPPRVAATGGKRRRALPLMPSVTGGADDLFADLFS